MTELQEKASFKTTLDLPALPFPDYFRHNKT